MIQTTNLGRYTHTLAHMPNVSNSTVAITLSSCKPFWQQKQNPQQTNIVYMKGTNKETREPASFTVSKIVQVPALPKLEGQRGSRSDRQGMFCSHHST